MTMTERLHRERIDASEFGPWQRWDTAHGKPVHHRTRVHRYMRAMRAGTFVPSAFVVREAGEELELSALWFGREQAAAAQELGLAKLDAWVFDADSTTEGEEIGALACDLAEAGQDVLTALRAHDAARASGGSCSVALFPAMRPAQRARVAARVRAARAKLAA